MTNMNIVSRKLLAKLEALKTAGTSEKKLASQKQSNDQVLTYHLQTLPAQNKLVQTARVANLEQRVHQLETAIGSTPENLVGIHPSYSYPPGASNVAT